MPSPVVESGARAGASSEPQLFSLLVTAVLDNQDEERRGRVLIKLPSVAVPVWAQVAAISAGSDHGFYDVPQVGDSVLVAFAKGAQGDPYVIGSLWKGARPLPARTKQDAVRRRFIRTPKNHEIVLDDEEGSITITSSQGHRVVIGKSSIQLETHSKSASLTLADDSGEITIKGKRVHLDAPTILIEGTNVDVKGKSSARIDGGSACFIQAGTVHIN